MQLHYNLCDVKGSLFANDLYLKMCVVKLLCYLSYLTHHVIEESLPLTPNQIYKAKILNFTCIKGMKGTTGYWHCILNCLHIPA